jgi:hypothetical protein
MRAIAEAPVSTRPVAATGARATWQGAEERQAAARDTYRAARQRGEALTGTELGTRFGMSERWGRDRIAEVRDEGGSSQGTDPDHPSAAAGNGNGPVLPLPADGSGGARHDGNGSTPVAADAANGTQRQPARRPASGNDGSRQDGNGAQAAAAGNGNGNGNGNGRSNGSPRAAVNGSRRPATGKNGNTPASAAAAGPSTYAGHAGTSETSTAQRRVMTTAVVVVATVAAAASYDHQRTLAELAGEGWRSWLLPLSVDGLLTAATMLMLTRRRAGQPAGTLTWIALALGVAASVAANVVGADPTLADPVLVGRIVAAWPPLALFLSLELLMQQLGTRQGGTR